jgi:hypothetical protein
MVCAAGWLNGLHRMVDGTGLICNTAQLVDALFVKQHHHPFLANAKSRRSLRNVVDAEDVTSMQ